MMRYNIVVCRKILIVFLMLIGVKGAMASDASIKPLQRVVGLHGSLTEIMASLGLRDEIVAVDRTALWPPQVRSLPQLGPHRMLNLEGIVSLRPDAILYCQSCGPQSVIDQLRTMDQPLHYVSQPESLMGIPDRIRSVGAIVDRVDRAELLAQAVAADLLAAKGQSSQPLRALFIFQMQANIVFVAGKHTAGVQLLTHIGLTPIDAGNQSWITPEPESLLAMQPDVLVVAGSVLDDPNILSQLLLRPGLAQSPAVRSGRVYQVDSMSVLGYGPRTGREILRLAQLLNPGVELPASQSAPLLLDVSDRWANQSRE